MKEANFLALRADPIIFAAISSLAGFFLLLSANNSLFGLALVAACLLASAAYQISRPAPRPFVEPLAVCALVAIGPAIAMATWSYQFSNFLEGGSRHMLDFLTPFVTVLGIGLAVGALAGFLVRRRVGNQRKSTASHPS